MVPLEADRFEDRRVQRLRQAAHLLEHPLRDLGDVAQLGPQRRSGRRLPLGAAEHRSHRRQRLAELVVQLPGEVAQRRLARGDELLGDVAPLARQRVEPGEQPPVRSNQVQAGDGDRGERRRQEPVDLPLDLIVDPLDPRRGRLLALVVVDQQPRDRRAERGLPGLQRQPDLRARLVLVPVARQREDPVGGVPELRQRIDQVLPLLGRAAAGADLRFAGQRVVEIAPDPLQRRRPGRERIGLAALGVEHVAHREPERVQIVLDAQQLQRVLAVAVGEAGLQLPQAADLAGQVVRVGRHRRQGDDHPRQQPPGRRPRLLRPHARALLQHRPDSGRRLTTTTSGVLLRQAYYVGRRT